MTIVEMKHGQWGLVDKIEGDPELCRRLMEIGFTPGEYIRRAAASPFNDPIVVNIRGASIALRRLEAGCIQIKLLADQVGT